MSVWRAALLLISATEGQESFATPYLAHIDDLANVAKHNDAKHRGARWYDYKSQSSSAESDQNSKYESSYSSSTEDSSKTSRSSSASSIETSEKKRDKRTYRHCTKCPEEMMKKHSNIGIKWLCAAYQRARRSFKSLCMMRFRNCQDGTMFVKLHDHRCANSTHHGRHWFYQYRV